MAESRTIRLTNEKRRWFLFLCTLAAFSYPLFSFFPNSLEMTVGILFIPLLFLAFWSSGNPPVLLFAIFYQWLQVYVSIFNQTSKGLELGVGLFSHLHVAAWLGLTAIGFFALGMKLGSSRVSTDGVVTAREREEALNLNANRLMFVYLVFLAAQVMLPIISSFLPSIYQPLYAVTRVRWLIVYLILWVGFRSSKYHLLAISVILVELAIGFGGYFSQFKHIFYVALMVLLGSRIPVRSMFKPSLFIGGVVLLLFLGFWQVIKSDYRDFLNRGSVQQVVERSVSERLDFLIERAKKVEFSDIQKGLDKGMSRLGYIEFFSLCIRRIPEYYPYQDGKLWGEAVEHVLKPRLFYPDKKAIDDSKRTREYTGLRVAGAKEGASIGLGYVAESYVDYGPIWMFVPVFIVGLFWGGGYTVLVLCTRYRVLGQAAGVNLVLGGAMLFETSNMKIVGGGITSLAVFAAFLMVCSGPLWRFLSGRPSKQKERFEYEIALLPNRS
jgi:hypothetical protein